MDKLDCGCPFGTPAQIFPVSEMTPDPRPFCLGCGATRKAHPRCSRGCAELEAYGLLPDVRWEWQSQSESPALPDPLSEESGWVALKGHDCEECRHA
jgi:hypothetical protein